MYPTSPPNVPVTVVSFPVWSPPFRFLQRHWRPFQPLWIPPSWLLSFLCNFSNHFPLRLPRPWARYLLVPRGFLPPVMVSCSPPSSNLFIRSCSALSLDIFWELMSLYGRPFAHFKQAWASPLAGNIPPPPLPLRCFGEQAPFRPSGYPPLSPLMSSLFHTCQSWCSATFERIGKSCSPGQSYFFRKT